MNEKQLIWQSIYTHNPQGYLQLVDRYQAKLYRAILIWVAFDENLAKQVCLASIKLAYRKLAQFNAEQTFFVWLLHIAFNELIRHDRAASAKEAPEKICQSIIGLDAELLERLAALSVTSRAFNQLIHMQKLSHTAVSFIIGSNATKGITHNSLSSVDIAAMGSYISTIEQHISQQHILPLPDMLPIQVQNDRIMDIIAVTMMSVLISAFIYWLLPWDMLQKLEPNGPNLLIIFNQVNLVELLIMLASLFIGLLISLALYFDWSAN